MRRTLIIVVCFASLASACASQPASILSMSPNATARPAGSSIPSATGDLFIVRTDYGLSAVQGGAGTIAWSVTRAVSAADGSAIFRTQRDGANTRLIQINPRTGVDAASWSLSGDLIPAAVAPVGRWVVLTDQTWPHKSDSSRPSTLFVVFDLTGQKEIARFGVDGDQAPEAFSVDGQTIISLRSFVDHYRVQRVELQTHFAADVGGRDKSLGEDMTGTAVQAVLSADHTLLSTLYSKPTNTTETAFVHVLDLEHNWSYCADLVAPFGTGPVGSDLVSNAKSGTLVVANRTGSIAEINVAAVHLNVAPPTADVPDPGADAAPFSVPGAAGSEVTVKISTVHDVNTLPDVVTKLPHFRQLVAVLAG